ncbi:sulfotransferase family 2 domain-containing protein [Shimia sp. FJ5]|uniref:sulfotransferase family 2 domain-containing protein n=1 Tax=Shimia sp. FJ5 TaxID=3079054 RepID=UPI00262C366F|nr:sulfotransferase family 2 domain-containing protein [Shimia sp. FJ5]MDV4144800.1 sulfotransferase family 2 domain-containing protein [Shimia sp. FJ5]
MADREGILSNYIHDRHFLQTVNMPRMGKPFIYMKNHKAACTTVLATLMAHLLDLQGEGTDGIDMETVHTPPKTLLRTGTRGLTVRRAMRALDNPDVFRFTIVREPVARTVSAYADKIYKAEKPKRMLMRYLGRPVDSEMSLSEFLDILAQDEGAREVDRHWWSQRKETSYDYIDFDFIGDTRDLKAALDHAMRQIFDVEASKFQDTRKTLGHKSHSRELMESLTTQDRANIETVFGPDLEMYEEVRKALEEVA